MIVFLAMFGLCVQVNAKILRGQVTLDKETDASLRSGTVNCQKKKQKVFCASESECAWNDAEKKCEPKQTVEVSMQRDKPKKLSDDLKNLNILTVQKKKESNAGIDIGDQASPQKTTPLDKPKKLPNYLRNLNIPTVQKKKESNDGIDIGDQASPQKTTPLDKPKKLPNYLKNLNIPTGQKKKESNDGIDIVDQASPQKIIQLESMTKHRVKGPAGRRLPKNRSERIRQDK